jgi:MSHA biogenesis protein MshM
VPHLSRRPGRGLCIGIYPFLEPRTLLLALAEELNVRLPRRDQQDQYQVIKGLTYALLGYAAAGRPVVLCLDEAQAMPIETFEALRLLTNLETEKRKLLQVVLFGQPELDSRLAHRSVRQLRQRITFQYRLEALRMDELASYLDHRLRVAGYQGGRVFAEPAVGALYRASRGVPRLVNIVAHKAMLLAYGEGRQQISAGQVRAAVIDTPAARQSWRGEWRYPPLIASALNALH